MDEREADVARTELSDHIWLIPPAVMGTLSQKPPAKIARNRRNSRSLTDAQIMRGVHWEVRTCPCSLSCDAQYPGSASFPVYRRRYRHKAAPSDWILFNRLLSEDSMEDVLRIHCMDLGQ